MEAQPAAKQVLRKVRLHSHFPTSAVSGNPGEDSFFTPQAVGHPMAGSRGGHVEVPRAAEPAASEAELRQRFAADLRCMSHTPCAVPLI